MKLCPHCSASLEDDTVQCSACGKWVISQPHGGGSGRRRRKGRKGGRGVRWVVLLAGAAAAWALWALPSGRVDPGKLLDLSREPADRLETLRAHMERLAVLEEEYFRLHGEYSGSAGALGFAEADGIHVSIIATPTGWSGTATHEDLPEDQGCAIHVGTVGAPSRPIRPGAPGAVFCTGGSGP